MFHVPLITATELEVMSDNLISSLILILK